MSTVSHSSQALLAAREEVLETLDGLTSTLLLSPGLGSLERQIEPVSDLYKAYVGLLANSHNSSSMSYAIRDLTPNERRKHDAVKHKIEMLQRLHAPQEVSA